MNKTLRNALYIIWLIVSAYFAGKGMNIGDAGMCCAAIVSCFAAAVTLIMSN